jgi:hypothetical protein
MTTETTDTHSPSPANTPLALKLTEGLGPLVEPVTLADVLDALNVFNRPKPSEDDGPWEAGHFIRVDHLPAFINIIAAAWFQPEAVRAAERERCKGLVRRYMPAGWSAVYDAMADEGPNAEVSRGRRPSR